MKFVTSRKRALIVATALIIAISIIVPVYANKPINFEASGTINGYVDAWSAMVVSGHWSVTIKEGVLEYKAIYFELNLNADEEDSPEGSVDIFTHNFTTNDPDDYELKGNVLTFSGTILRWKVWSQFDGTTIPVDANQPVSITITRETFFLDHQTSGSQDWNKYGKTNYFLISLFS